MHRKIRSGQERQGYLNTRNIITQLEKGWVRLAYKWRRVTHNSKKYQEN